MADHSFLQSVFQSLCAVNRSGGVWFAVEGQKVGFKLKYV